MDAREMILYIIIGSIGLIIIPPGLISSYLRWNTTSKKTSKGAEFASLVGITALCMAVAKLLEGLTKGYYVHLFSLNISIVNIVMWPVAIIALTIAIILGIKDRYDSVNPNTLIHFIWLFASVILALFMDD